MGSEVENTEDRSYREQYIIGVTDPNIRIKGKQTSKIQRLELRERREAVGSG